MNSSFSTRSSARSSTSPPWQARSTERKDSVLLESLTRRAAAALTSRQRGEVRRLRPSRRSQRPACTPWSDTNRPTWEDGHEDTRCADVHDYRRGHGGARDVVVRILDRPSSEVRLRAAVGGGR